MNTPLPQRAIRFKIMAVFIFLLSGFFAWLNISEFVTVGLLQETGGYPFGGESPAPWYYESSVLYAGVTLAFSFVFLLCCILAVWASFKGKTQLLLIALSITLLAILLQVLSGAAQ
jgi:hypothetical protein